MKKAHEAVEKFLALRARDIMKRRVISIRQDATVREAAELFLRGRFSGAPVINEGGRAVGVLTLKDIGRFTAQRLWAEEEDQAIREGAGREAQPLDPGGFQIDRMEGITVSQVMTPFVQFVTSEASLREIVQGFHKGLYHRVFVVDADRVVVGVISTVDVLGVMEEVVLAPLAVRARKPAAAKSTSRPKAHARG